MGHPIPSTVPSLPVPLPNRLSRSGLVPVGGCTPDRNAPPPPSPPLPLTMGHPIPSTVPSLPVPLPNRLSRSGLAPVGGCTPDRNDPPPPSPPQTPKSTKKNLPPLLKIRYNSPSSDAKRESRERPPPNPSPPKKNPAKPKKTPNPKKSEPQGVTSSSRGSSRLCFPGGRRLMFLRRRPCRPTFPAG